MKTLLSLARRLKALAGGGAKKAVEDQLSHQPRPTILTLLSICYHSKRLVGWNDFFQPQFFTKETAHPRCMGEGKKEADFDIYN